MTGTFNARGVIAGSCATLLMGLTAFGLPARADAPESSDPVKIVLNNWTSQVVLANVTGELLRKLGYNVELVPSDNQLQFSGMANGDLHMQIEVWEGTHKTNFEKFVDTGNLLDAGTHDAITREEWWYPHYMEARCPGLPDWEALHACASEFATAETAPKGRYLGGPIDWGKHHNERVQALGMDFVVVNAGQASTLWAELDAAYRRRGAHHPLPTGRPTGSRRSTRDASSIFPTTLRNACRIRAGARIRTCPMTVGHPRRAG